MPAKPSAYEKIQFRKIKKWKQEKPSVLSQSIGTALSPLSQLAAQLIPTVAIRKVLEFSNVAAEWLTDKNDILRDGEVSTIGALLTKDIE